MPDHFYVFLVMETLGLDNIFFIDVEALNDISGTCSDDECQYYCLPNSRWLQWHSRDNKSSSKSIIVGHLVPLFLSKNKE